MFFQVHVLPRLRVMTILIMSLLSIRQTMITHHSVFHHQGYVNKLNEALKGTKRMNEKLNSILMNISYYNNTAVRYNSGGHYNHSLYWKILNPNSSNKQPSEDLSNQITKVLRALDLLKQEMKRGFKRFGSGWVWLIISPNGELKVTSTANEDNPIMDVNKERGIPVIAIDVWEHAYYLKYQNKRNDYLGAIWQLIDWEIVSE